jgi:hypothetical protein
MKAVLEPRRVRGVGQVLFREAPWRGPGERACVGALFLCADRPSQPPAHTSFDHGSPWCGVLYEH